MNTAISMRLPYIIMFVLAFTCCSNTDKKLDFTVRSIEDENLDFLMDKDTLLVDSRSTESFDSSNFPCSVNITSTMIKYDPSEVMKILNSRQYKRIVIYCYGNTCDTSSTVARYLVYTGKDIAVYKPGWQTIRNLCPKY